MTLEEAIKARHSVRAYKAQPLAEEIVKVLEKEIEGQNCQGHLHIQLIKNEPKAFQGKLAKYGKFSNVTKLAKYGKFSNVTNYLVMAGQKAEDLDERIGYYGEHLVLLAQTLGLNTCWVGLSYSKIPGTYVLEESEVIKAYIAIGYGETQGVGHKIKTVGKTSNASDITPSWFRKGVEAALLAPTAVNQQKFFFEYIPAKDSKPAQVIAKRNFSLIGFTQMDLGMSVPERTTSNGHEDQ